MCTKKVGLELPKELESLLLACCMIVYTIRQALGIRLLNNRSKDVVERMTLGIFCQSKSKPITRYDDDFDESCKSNRRGSLLMNGYVSYSLHDKQVEKSDYIRLLTDYNRYP